MSRLGRGFPIRSQVQRGVIGVHVSDAATVGLVLTASGVEVYTPSVPTTDSGTISFKLTASGSDTYTPSVPTTDSGTIGLVLTASATETYTPSVPTTDSGTARAVLTPSAVETYTPSVPTTDSGTIAVALTPSASETYTPSVPTTETGTIAFKLTASATETYTPSVPTTDASTAVAVLTPSGVELRERTDSATVTLGLVPLAVAPGGVFPTTSLLDDFQRADADPITGNWTCGIYVGERLTIVDGEIVNPSSGWGSAYWNATLFGANQEVWFEFGTDPFGSVGASQATFPGTELAVRISNGNTSSPNGYFFHFQANSVQLYRMLAGVQDSVGSPGVWSNIASGDKIGVEANGNYLRAYEKIGSGAWTMILEIDVSIADDTPNLGGGYIGLLDNAVSYENFGGGNIVPTGPVDTYHAVDSGTATLAFTPSGADVYTPVAGIAYTDSATAVALFTVSGTELRDQTDAATATLTLTPGVAAAAAGATLLDDFNRADAATWGANWTKVVSRGNTDIKLAGNKAYFDGNSERSYEWAAGAIFGSDQEAYYTVTDIPYNGSRVFFLLCANAPATATYTGYLMQVQYNFSNWDATIWRANSNTFTQLGTVTSVSYGGSPFGIGDVWKATKVGDQLTLYRNGVAFLGPLTDPAPLSTGPYWLGVGGNANDGSAGTTMKIDNFYGGTYGTTTPGETFQGVDAVTASVLLTPSGVDVYTPVVGTAYTDSATAPLAFTVSATELRDQTDAATVPLTFTVSAAEVYDRTDAGTISLVLTASGTELELVVDAATASITLTPSSTDTLVAGGVYTDSATASVLFTPSSTEFESVVDAQTVPLTFTPSALEARTVTDAATVSLTFTLSTIETQEAVDAATITIRVTGTTVEAKEAQDAATAVLGLTPSAVVSFAGSDAALATLVLSPSGVEQHDVGGVFTDSATARATFTVSGTELAAGVEAGTVSITLTPSTVESYGRTDAATASLLFTPSGVDTYTTASAFTDTGTAILGLTASSVEGIERQDTGTATLSLTVTYASAYGTTDAATGQVTLTPSALSERGTLDTATVPFAFTITSTEEIAVEDADTLYLHLTPKSYLTFDNPLLVGILSSSYTGSLRARSYSATVGSHPFATRITAPRFTATVSIDTVGDIEPHYTGTIRR